MFAVVSQGCDYKKRRDHVWDSVCPATSIDEGGKEEDREGVEEFDG